MADITNISVGGTSYTIKDSGAVRDVSGKANLASPTFTGTPAAPTAAAGTNTTQIATTAFVQTAIGSKAPLASPALTGTPTAPTAAASTNSTQIATTAFVNTEMNRTNAVNAANTSYTTYMARGLSLNSADTNPTVNGTISWTYK